MAVQEDFLLEGVEWAEDSADGGAGRLLLQLSARTQLVAVALACRPGRVFLAVPGGVLAVSRFRARSGPLFRRHPLRVGLYSDALDQLCDADGEPVDVALDILEASPEVLVSCVPFAGNAFLPDHPGYWPGPADLLDGIAGILAAFDAGPVLPPEPVLPKVASRRLAEPPTPANPPALAGPPAPAGTPPDPAHSAVGALDPAFISELLALQRMRHEGTALPFSPPPAPALAHPAAPPPSLAAAAPPGLGAVPKTPGPPPLMGGDVTPRASEVFAGLDPSVVAQARAAGVPESDLAVFARVMAAGTRRPPEPVPPRTADPPVDLVGDPPPPVDRIDRLIDALSSVFADRGTGSGAGPSDPTERALTFMDAPRSGEPTTGRRGAAARLALRRALTQNPEHYSQYVAAQLASAFVSRSATGDAPTMREYLELRSRVGNHRPTISWMWAVAGARDALAAGRVPEALARLDLAIVAGEQCSIDGGSWVLAQELLWEDDPPFHAFSGHRPADPTRAAHSHLCDPRWAEAALSRLKELDEWNERRRRLGGGFNRPPIPPVGAGAGGDGTPEAGANAKAKGAPRRPNAKAASP